MANERAGGPPRLGELERAVMDVLWNAPERKHRAGSWNSWLPATAPRGDHDDADGPGPPGRKDFVTRERQAEPTATRAARTRDD